MAGDWCRYGSLPSAGISFVIVNGTVVVRDSKVRADVKLGQPIRYPVKGKGRLEPVDVKRWINEKTITPVELPSLDYTGAHEVLVETGDD